MPQPHPRLFTIPASVPFLPALIRSLLDGRIISGLSTDPLALAAGTIYLPTRRACHLLRDCFLESLGTEAAILPRLVPLGDVDIDEFAFAEMALEGTAGALLETKQPIGPLQRRLSLTQLVRDWAARQVGGDAKASPLVANTPQAALSLADALARLIDDMETRKVPWEALDDLVADELDEYWQLTLSILKLAREEWPELLSARGEIEPACHRDLMIAAEADRLKRGGESFVIAAGSTASMPSTALLLSTIARLPNGAVVLPGLDSDLDEAAWNLLADADSVSPIAVHPQFSMQGFLRDLGVARSEVKALAPPEPHGRERLVSEALRPAASTERWSEQRAAADIPRALDAMAMIEAAGPEEEALAIAVALRETLEEKDQRAILVTPDRGLARRVVAALRRWGIDANDSGGDPMSQTSAGVFARLTAQAAADRLSPVTLLALLKHPLLRLGRREGESAERVSILERSLLRGPRPAPGSVALVRALQTLRTARDALHASDARHQLKEKELNQAEELARAVSNALLAFEALAGPARPLAEIASAHYQALLALGADADGRLDVFSGEDGEALAEILEELSAGMAARAMHLHLRDYPEFFTAAIHDRAVRRVENPDARVSILGLLEARLQSAHRIVLGGLVEGVWPPQARGDAWLSRPMRQQLGLDLPERRIGLTAHDFAQALGAREVVLSRSLKVSGTPTVASRFVQRLAAVSGEAQWKAALGRGTRYIQLARMLDEPGSPRALERPQPRPPVEMRPRRLSVTQIEDLLRDPYTIYARHILRLNKMDPVDCPPGPADRGSAIHNAIGDFTKQYPHTLPSNAYEELLRFGRASFAPLADYPDAQAFWWPRFERVAQWFIPWETERRASTKAIYPEVKGALELTGLKHPFRLTVRADRIEQLTDGRYAILDYKTGRPPSSAQVLCGLSPQLTLEGAILCHGGFEGLPSGGSIAELTYVRVHGGEPGGLVFPVDMKKSTPDREADEARERLTEVIARFDDPTQPYLSMVRPMWRTFYGDYDHLARIREWSMTGGVAEEVAEP